MRAKLCQTIIETVFKARFNLMIVDKTRTHVKACGDKVFAGVFVRLGVSQAALGNDFIEAIVEGL